MMPTFFGMLIVVALSLRREGHVLREHLRRDLATGLITEADYACLCSVGGRMGASFSALAGGGFSHWRARARFNRAASELAFHRSRVARGIHTRGANDAEREADYVQQIYRLRLQLERK